MFGASFRKCNSAANNAGLLSGNKKARTISAKLSGCRMFWLTFPNAASDRRMPLTYRDRGTRGTQLDIMSGKAKLGFLWKAVMSVTSGGRCIGRGHGTRGPALVLSSTVPPAPSTTQRRSSKRNGARGLMQRASQKNSDLAARCRRSRARGGGPLRTRSRRSTSRLRQAHQEGRHERCRCDQRAGERRAWERTMIVDGRLWVRIGSKQSAVARMFAAGYLPST
jgi:hypothetical protein